MIRAAALLLVAIAAGEARALPTVGSMLPAINVENPDGRDQAVPMPDRPTLILYESRSSRPQNFPLKSRLKLLAKESPAARERLDFVPIANLEAYNFWPVRGFAAGAVRSEQTRLGHSIYCDWNGTVAKTLGAKTEQSSVILVDRGGTVLFASEGPLGLEAQEQVLALLREELQ